MGDPANYKVLFLQGGASSQFAMVPMNLLRGKAGADYLNTGEWSKKAIKEAKRYGEVNVVAPVRGGQELHHAPTQDEWKLDADAAYVHYTPNETIGGVEFTGFPRSARAAGGRHVVDHPVAPDRRVEVRRDLRRRAEEHRPGRADHRHRPRGPDRQTVAGTPTMFDYKTHAEERIDVQHAADLRLVHCGLVFKWLKARGGLAAMAETNREKAGLLYDALDATGFYNEPGRSEGKPFAG
jgi:phosphoserine aminotransferase